MKRLKNGRNQHKVSVLGPVYMEWGTPVSFFCFVSSRAWKQKKPTPLDRGPPLYVNRPLRGQWNWDLNYCVNCICWNLRLSRFIEAIMEQIDCVYVLLYCPASSAVNRALKSVINYTYGLILGDSSWTTIKKSWIFFLPQTGDATNTQVVKHVNFLLRSWEAHSEPNGM